MLKKKVATFVRFAGQKLLESKYFTQFKIFLAPRRDTDKYTLKLFLIAQNVRINQILPGE